MSHSILSLCLSICLCVSHHQQQQQVVAAASPGGPQASPGGPLTAGELLAVHASMHDLHRLDMYARNMVDHHMVLDLVPLLATWLFQGRLPAIRLSYLQVGVRLGCVW